MGVKKRRQWTGLIDPPIVGYCPNPKCGKAINEIVFRRNDRVDPRGFVSGETYTCGVCDYRWTQ